MIDFLDLVSKRYSTRKYKSQNVEEEKLLRILEAGRVAPTAKNTQPQRILVVKEQEGLKKLNKVTNTFGASLALIICADHLKSCKRPYDGKDVADIDASIVTDHMMLQATELSLETLWICYFDPSILKKEFHIPENYEPINILLIGYGDGKSKSANRHSSERFPLNNTVFFEDFNIK
jgi:nitroreductase